MPRLSAFYGIVIYMYVRDHGVAHFHARHSGEEAVIAVASGEVLGGHLAPRQLRLVAEWASIHRSELLAAWDAASAGDPPGTIDPLP